MNTTKLLDYLNSYLEINNIKDYAYNGLQVEGDSNITNIAYGVSASLNLFKEAKNNNCNTIIVHHGLFWDNIKYIKNYLKDRLLFLLSNNINLIAYHLPLDKHKELGNNINLIKLFKPSKIKEWGLYNNKEIGYYGELDNYLELSNIIDILKQNIEINPSYYNYNNKKIKSLAVISGGSSDAINQAIDANIDLFITGENKEYIQEICKETGIAYLALGHYNSEKLGIMSLKDHIKNKFNIDGRFIDIPNPN